MLPSVGASHRVAPSGSKEPRRPGDSPVHPISHRTIHAYFSNVDLERHAEDGVPLETNPQIARFLRWIAGKPPDFHAPTRRSR